MARRRPSSPPPVPAPPLEDDDLLHEILLRLPPQPVYLLRASLVSKRWRRLATDPQFLRRFRVHHGRPPLLGLFSDRDGKFSFRSTQDPPCRIPPGRLSPRLDGHEAWRLLDCRHGRVLFDDRKRRQVVLWDPITDDHCFVAVPPPFDDPGAIVCYWAVLCAAGDQGHVHGACHSTPFKVVALNLHEHDDEPSAFVSVYSSEAGIWSDLISSAVPHMDISFARPSTLVGNTLHWLLMGYDSTGILEFDLDTQRLVVTMIERPPVVCRGVDSFQIIEAEDGGVGFAALSTPLYHPRFQLWERKLDSYGFAKWVLRKTVELQKILGFRFRINARLSSIVGYAEQVHAIFLRVHSSVFMLQLNSMKSKELCTNDEFRIYHPFTSFYTEGWNRSGKDVNTLFPDALFSKSPVQDKEAQLKKDYKVVKSIISGSGISWNPTTCMINTTAKKWDEIIEGDSKLRKFEGKSSPVFEALDLLHESNIAQGKHCFTCSQPSVSTSRKHHRDENHSSRILPPGMDAMTSQYHNDTRQGEGRNMFNDVERTDAYPYHNDEVAVPQGGDVDQDVQTSGDQAQSISGNGGAQSARPKKQKGNTSFSRIADTMSDYVKLKREQATMKEQASIQGQQYSIPRCLEVLNAMDDVSDEIKVLASDVFKDAAN